MIKIGHIQPLTGPSAAYGIRARDGAIIAVDEINAAGGWTDAAGKKYQIEMSVGDMANDPKQAITLFRQYATDPQVIAVLGPTNSVGYVPLVPVAGQIKLPSIGNGSGAPIKEWNPYGFRVNPVATVAVPVLLQKVVAKEGIKKLAVIYDQTQDAQAGDAKVCKELASKIGYEIVAFEAFRAGDQDFSPQITKIRSLKPDAIYVAAATGDGIKVVSQIREAGIDKRADHRLRLVPGSRSTGTAPRGVVKGDYTWLAQDLTSPSAPSEDIPRQVQRALYAAGGDLVLDLRLRQRDGTHGGPQEGRRARPRQGCSSLRRLRRDDLARHPHHLQEPARRQQRQSLGRRHPDHRPRQLRGSLMRYAAC